MPENQSVVNTIVQPIEVMQPDDTSAQAAELPNLPRSPKVTFLGDLNAPLNGRVFVIQTSDKLFFNAEHRSWVEELFDATLFRSLPEAKSALLMSSNHFNTLAGVHLDGRVLEYKLRFVGEHLM